MIPSACLASYELSAIHRVVPTGKSTSQTCVLFISTAAHGEKNPVWIEHDRAWFAREGFLVTEFDLASETPQSTKVAIENADLVYAAGGNTFVLLHHMQRTNFWEAMRQAEVPYAGSSAGAIVACPDIAYVAGLDDPSAAPDLRSTKGAGLINAFVLPHLENERFHDAVLDIQANWKNSLPLLLIRDNQAVIVRNEVWEIIHSSDE